MKTFTADDIGETYLIKHEDGKQHDTTAIHPGKDATYTYSNSADKAKKVAERMAKSLPR